MGEAILLFIMGLACLTLSVVLPVLPIIMILLVVGGIVKTILKIFHTK